MFQILVLCAFHTSINMCTARILKYKWLHVLAHANVFLPHAGLARIASLAGGNTAGMEGAVHALWACATAKNVFCRVRAEAALALALPQGTAELALPLLSG